MHWKKAFILSILSLLSLTTWAQRPKVHHGGKSMYTRERFNHNVTKVRGKKAQVVCPIFEKSKYPYHGLGLKFGDPFALTYKYYATKHFSIVADAGKPASGLYNRYYRERFEEGAAQDTMSAGIANLQYVTHKIKMDLIAELKLLYHVDATSISAGLQVYIGAGWEWKHTKIEYDYLYDEGDRNRLDENGRSQVSQFSMGPQGVIGIEYAYFKIPISAFMELEYFTDIQEDPGFSRIEGGVGLRYIF